MDYEEFSGKTVEDAITAACTKFTITSDRLDYEVLEKGTSGFLGINSKPATIKARIRSNDVPEEKKDSAETVSAVSASAETAQVSEEKKGLPASGAEMEETVRKFLEDVFKAMDMQVVITVKFDPEEPCINVNLDGGEMGVLIGKRGQTLDSLQYLISLVVNKGKGDYVRVKVDTENYRARRKETLENLAKNLSYKVKRTRRPVSLEPMNPYERRIIHSALQNDKYVTTHSEGEEPFRRVIISLKK